MTVWSQLVAAPTLAFANLSAAALYLNHSKSDTNHSFGRKRDVHRGVTRLQIKETSFLAAAGLVSPDCFPVPTCDAIGRILLCLQMSLGFTSAMTEVNFSSFRKQQALYEQDSDVDVFHSPARLVHERPAPSPSLREWPAQRSTRLIRRVQL